MSAEIALIDLRALSDPAGIENPYWATVRQLPDSRLNFDDRWSPDGFGFDLRTYQTRGPSRDDLVTRYAWAITDPMSVAFVARHAPNGIVEIGAGSGYWAWQLTQRGVDVVAYDVAPPHTHPNKYCQQAAADPRDALRPLFYPVAEIGHTAATRHPDRALFLCWPPYSSSMARDALAFYDGDRLIYIGEGEGGCTADDDFHAALDAEWTEVDSHKPVQWGGIRDWITVYDRAGAAS